MGNIIFPISPRIVISSSRDINTFRNSSPQCAADDCTSVTHHKGAANTLVLSVSGSFAKTTGRLPVLLNYSNKKEPIICLSVYRVFSLTWQASMQIYWNKRKRLHKKSVQPPDDWFGTPTWPPFYCFGTPIWPPWRHVKTLYWLSFFIFAQKHAGLEK